MCTSVDFQMLNPGGLKGRGAEGAAEKLGFLHPEKTENLWKTKKTRKSKNRGAGFSMAGKMSVEEFKQWF